MCPIAILCDQTTGVPSDRLLLQGRPNFLCFLPPRLEAALRSPWQRAAGYRERTASLRQLALESEIADTRSLMLELAEQYDELAAIIEARSSSSVPPA